MTVTIGTFDRGYGVTGWTLESSEYGSFYLGDYGKVCWRLLGQRPEETAYALAIATGQSGRPCTWNDDVKSLLAETILDVLGIEEFDLAELEPWALAVE